MTSGLFSGHENQHCWFAELDQAMTTQRHESLSVLRNIDFTDRGSVLLT